jgi:hypothetical protein
MTKKNRERWSSFTYLPIAKTHWTYLTIKQEDDFESIFQTLTSWTERGNALFWRLRSSPVDHTDAKDVYCNFVDNSYVRDSYIPGLQSLSVLSEDVTDVTFENTIYHRVRGGIGQQIEISMRDDNLQICRFKDVHVFCLVHFRRR